ncbi:MAG: SCO family protein [Candidatus Rokubacteria bacterium]|nr:SCO family protein [Candidatus Rokubacteria bacterium]
MKPPRLVWASLLAIATAAAGLALWLALGGSRGPEQSQGVLETLDVYGELPDFRLTERSGRAVTRADLAGKVWVANFIYTRCTDSCPLQTAELARLQGELLSDGRVRLVSITVDPEHDTPAVLRRYAERYRADPGGWLFLTGDRAAIYRLARDGFKLGVLDPDDAAGGLFRRLGPAPAFATHGSKGLVMHSPRLVLVDGRARVRAYHQPDDPGSRERLRANLRALLAER